MQKGCLLKALNFFDLDSMTKLQQRRTYNGIGRASKPLFIANKMFEKIDRILFYTPMMSIPFSDVNLDAMTSQITSLTIVYSSAYSGADKKRKHQSSATLAFARGIHRWPLNSPHKGPVTRKMLPFYDVIMFLSSVFLVNQCTMVIFDSLMDLKHQEHDWI